jgi:hypothetical protein
MNRDNSVSIALGYGLDDRGFESRKVGWEFFSSPPRLDRFWGPPSLLSNGYQGLFPWGVKRSDREADHSPLPSAEVVVLSLKKRALLFKDISEKFSTKEILLTI